MAEQKKILITFDCELFLGKRSGSVPNCMLLPTTKILWLLKKHKITAIFFVDMLYLCRLKEEAEKHTQAKGDFENIQTQIIEMAEQGHYVFMTIIQGMIISLNFFTHHSNHPDNEENINHYMHITAMLMWGSEAALKFAGDFSNFAYDSEVRPTLSPPIAPPGMSGLYWRDHEFFIKKIIFKLKPVFSNPPHFLEEAVNSFREALACVYDAHKLVCTKFVGHTESSLISKKPAGVVLQNYKKNRMHVFTP